MKNKFQSFKLQVVSILFLFSTVITLCSAQTFSQYNFNDDTVTYNSLNTNNASYLTTGDDEVSSVKPIGFAFTYHGTNYTSFSASTNGFIQLGNSAINPNGNYNNDLSSPTFNPVIAPLWDDLVTTDSVWYKVTGIAPNRTLNVEWRRVKWDFQAVDNNIEFMVRLHETTNAIDFDYGAIGLINNPSASIGINYSPLDFASVTPGVGGFNATLSTTIADSSVVEFPGNGAGYRYTFTPPPGDFSPPLISNINYNPTIICTPVVVAITTTLTDLNSGVSLASLWYNVNNSGYVNATLSLVSGDSLTGNYSAIIPAQVAGSSIDFYIEATDNLANTVNSDVQTISYSTLSVNAGLDQTINSSTTAMLNAVVSTTFNYNVKISEVVLYKDGVGATANYPGYIDSLAQDFIELTNLNSTPVNLGGYQIETYDDNGLERAYTLPATLSLDTNAVAVIHLGPGIDSIAVNYYNTGGTENYYSSSISAGFVIKNAVGDVIDATATNSFSFPVSSGVTIANWSGNVASSIGKAGIIRNGKDKNSNLNWAISTPNKHMTLGNLNSGLIANDDSINLVWNPGGLLTNTITTPVLTSNITYTVTVTDGVCTTADTVVVNVVTPVSPVAAFYTSTVCTYENADVNLFDTSANIPDAWLWTITPNTFSFINGTTANSKNPVLQFSQTGFYTIKLTVINAAGMDSITKIDYVVVNTAYCLPQYSIGASNQDYIKGIRLATLNNWPTINDSISYHDYYCSDAAILDTANTYTLSVLNGQGTNEYINAWIDYDNNGFFDSFELLGTAFAADSLQPYYIVFTTPSTINSTSTRMRVRMTGNNSLIGPCSNTASGETEDYRIDFSNCSTPPIVNLGNDTTFCGNPFVFNLDAGNLGASYVWQIGMNTQQLTVDTSGTYAVDVTYADGCHARDSIVITGIPIVATNAGFNFTSTNLVATFSNTSTNATAYFWTFGDGSSSTVASPSYTYTATGQYSVTLIASNNCALDTQQFLITITNVGIAAINASIDELLVSPNPSNGLINLKFEIATASKTKIEVYNNIGSKISEQEFGKLSGKQNLNLDFSNLPKGVYFLKLLTDGNTKTKLILIH